MLAALKAGRLSPQPGGPPGPARARGRCDRGHRRPAPCRDGAAHRGRSVDAWDPDITIVMDADYDVTRLAGVLRDLSVELVGRIRSDRVMRCPAPSREEFHRAHPRGGHSPKHGAEFRFAKPETCPQAAIITATDTVNYRKAETQAWDRVHPRLTHRSVWLEYDGELPILEGSLVRLKVEHLSIDREAPALGEAGQARTPHPGPGPTRVQEHPSTPPLPRPCSPTSRRWSRTATRHQEPPSPPRYDVGKTSNAPRPSRSSAELEDLGSWRTRASIAPRCG
ncbi:transposase [Streptomyces anulatus]|uniref:transposase n=1 Tax=Streptomyces anulatus TaxID=1892 RepID=UPI002F911C22